MRTRPYLAVTVFFCWLVAHVAPVRAVDIYAQLFPLTGEVRLLNRDAAPIPFVYYSITSAGNALDGDSLVWQSIAANYDVSGNGLIDPSNEWFILADDPDELTEGVFTGSGGSLPPTRAISLGQIWNPFDSVDPFVDLAFDIHDDSQSIPVTIELALDGDYTADGIVDAADYAVWRQYLTSTDAPFADGDLSGLVDMGDYLVWRENFGLTLPLPPYGSGSGSQLSPLSAHAGVVPEPDTGALLLIAIGLSAFAIWRIRLARTNADSY